MEIRHERKGDIKHDMIYLINETPMECLRLRAGAVVISEGVNGKKYMGMQVTFGENNE